jgi:hypothetical protein
MPLNFGRVPLFAFSASAVGAGRAGGRGDGASADALGSAPAAPVGHRFDVSTGALSAGTSLLVAVILRPKTAR